jgi:hypothetical protein
MLPRGLAIMIGSCLCLAALASVNQCIDDRPRHFKYRRIIPVLVRLHLHRPVRASECNDTIFLPVGLATVSARPEPSESACTRPALEDPVSSVVRSRELAMTWTPQEVAQAETRVSAYPQDVETRGALLFYYVQKDLWTERLDHVYWMIEHAPDSGWVTAGLCNLRPERASVGAERHVSAGPEYERGKALWEKQIAERPHDARLRANAASYFEPDNPGAAVENLKAAQEIEPDNGSFSLALARISGETRPGRLSGIPIGTCVPNNVAVTRLLRQTMPSYPPLARQARIQGTAVLNALVSKDGAISSLQLVSGHPWLVPAAGLAASQWGVRAFYLARRAD